MLKKYGIATLLIFELVVFVVLGYFGGDFLEYTGAVQPST